MGEVVGVSPQDGQMTSPDSSWIWVSEVSSLTSRWLNSCQQWSSSVLEGKNTGSTPHSSAENHSPYLGRGGVLDLGDDLVDDSLGDLEMDLTGLGSYLGCNVHER